MKYLIVGLGNPGLEYYNTRHNIGFRVLDFLAEKSSISFSDKRYGFRSEFKIKGRTLVLVKPTTYMNLSGKAINYYMQKEKIPIERVLIIVDDIALPFGTIRIKSKGGSGGHNGLSHIESTLGDSNYFRLRFGVGSDFGQGRQVDYVLGEWSDEEKSKLKERMQIAIEAISQFPLIGIQRTMNFYNNK